MGKAFPAGHVTVAAVIKMVGVSRARVYQRVRGTHAKRGSGRGLPYRESKRGWLVDEGRYPKLVHLAIPLDAAVAWRDERLAAKLPVGPVPAPAKLAP